MWCKNLLGEQVSLPPLSTHYSNSKSPEKLSNLMKNYQNGGVAHFDEKVVPEVFVEFEGDTAWWHNAMLDLVLLNSDPNHTQINHCLALSSSKKRSVAFR